MMPPSGIPFVMCVHVWPPSRVRSMCGRRSSRWNVLIAAALHLDIQRLRVDAV